MQEYPNTSSTEIWRAVNAAHVFRKSGITDPAIIDAVESASQSWKKSSGHAFEEMINNGPIEPAHLSTLRGRDLKNCIILVDEAENLLTSNIQLLLGRVAKNTEIIFCADVKQCDYQNEKMSGIPKMISALKNNKLFGMVKLVKTERSDVAALADLMD